eukprot:9484978-Pyramimonas_sp.AAC.1
MTNRLAGARRVPRGRIFQTARHDRCDPRRFRSSPSPHPVDCANRGPRAFELRGFEGVVSARQSSWRNLQR